MIKYDHVWCERNVFICENECKCKYWRWHSRYQIAIANYNMQKSIEFFSKFIRTSCFELSILICIKMFCSGSDPYRINPQYSRAMVQIDFLAAVFESEKSRHILIYILNVFCNNEKIKKSSFHFFYAPKTFTFTFIP